MSQDLKKTIVLSTVRATFVHIQNPATFKDDQGDEKEPKFGATFLFPYGHPDIAKIESLMKLHYAANKESKFNGVPMTSKKFWVPLRDGEEWLETHPNALEYEGHMFLKASSKNRPVVFDEHGEELLDFSNIKSGYHYRAEIAIWPFAKSGNLGFSFFINSIKFMKEDEILGGSEASHSAYEEEEDASSAAPARRTNAPAARTNAAPARPAPKAAAPEPLYDVDANGDDIVSFDNGVNWEFI